jgi:hypothetical protein
MTESGADWHIAMCHTTALNCHAVQVTKRALCLPKLTDNPFKSVYTCPWTLVQYGTSAPCTSAFPSDCNTVIRVPLTFQAPPIHLVCFRNDSYQHHDYQRMKALRCTCCGAEQNVLDSMMMWPLCADWILLWRLLDTQDAPQAGADDNWKLPGRHRTSGNRHDPLISGSQKRGPTTTEDKV